MESELVPQIIFGAPKCKKYAARPMIDSDDTSMFNWFQTFSAANLHFDDLHFVIIFNSLDNKSIS